MSDDLHIPAAGRGSAPIRSSYQPRRPGMDRGAKIMLTAAAGLGGLLLAGVAGWALSGGRHATVVPVIEADSRPVRVKPENPGGLQVAGADEQVMGGSGSKIQGMAPPPESPAAQALRAQMPPLAAVLPPAAPQLTPPVAAPSVAVVPPPATPVPAARQASPAAGTLVQLAAVDNEDAAQTEWQRLAKRMPDLLGDRRPVVQRAERDGHAVWRVRTGGFTDIADATAFCARVRAKGGACSIAGS